MAMFSSFDEKNSNKVKTAIVPVAGFGIRMLPITKLIPKEMLPLVDQPIIEFIIHECISSGIHNIILVTNSSKSSIENYLDTNFKIIDILKYQNEVINNIFNQKKLCCVLDNITVVSIRQKFHKGVGLGHAILSAYPLIGNNPVVVVLPDVIIRNYHNNVYTDNLTQMLERFSKTHRSQILIKQVNKKDIVNYGIVINYRVKNERFNESIEIMKIIEKPVTTGLISSNLAIVGRYVFSHRIWDALKILSNMDNKEMELTDAISILITKEIVEGLYLKGLSYDCGNKLGYMQAFVDYGIRHKVLGKDFKVWLKSLFFK